MKTALLQITSSDDPAENLEMVRAMVAEAAGQGARFVLTPEVTNCVSTSTTRQRAVLQHEEDDITLAGLRQQAADLGIWLLIGSLCIKTHDADGRFANRSFLINPQGQVAAWYDKVHMFDVQGHRIRDLPRIGQLPPRCKGSGGRDRFRQGRSEHLL